MFVVIITLVLIKKKNFFFIKMLLTRRSKQRVKQNKVCVLSFLCSANALGSEPVTWEVSEGLSFDKMCQ